MDLSNIYNLSEEKLNQYRENPFPDDEVRPGIKLFAEKLKKDILALHTPYVLVLEGGYGVGKTYFITRFCEYLKKCRYDSDIPMKSVYLNLWENDYVANPFPVIVSQIIQQLNPAKEILDDITKKAIQVTNNLIKFGAKAFSGINIGDVLPNPKQDKQDLSDFKHSLQKMIADTGSKVVLVVDEIDRCRPDYAVKSLETIKHFFDIDGLFVLLTTKLDFMDSICEAYYGHPKCEINTGEGYIQKFVQSKKILNPISQEDYAFIMRGIFDKNSLPVKELGYGQIENINSPENARGIEHFIKIMSQCFYEAGFSVRKTIDICNEIRLLIQQNAKQVWTGMVDNFPELIIIKYLKEKGILPEKIEEPDVAWNHDDFYNENDELIQNRLKMLMY